MLKVFANAEAVVLTQLMSDEYWLFLINLIYQQYTEIKYMLPNSPSSLQRNRHYWVCSLNLGNTMDP